MEFKINVNQAGQRIDKFLNENLKDITRSQIQNMMVDGKVSVNGKVAKKNYKVEEDDEINIDLQEKPRTGINPIKKTLKIIYEDSDIVVVNKPPFITVHQDRNQTHEITIINILLGNKIKLSKLGGSDRPGIVHRLDKDTSGLLLIAKTDKAYKTLRTQFENRQIEKTYIGLVSGEMESKKGRIESPIARDTKDRKKMAVNASKDAKNAISEFKVLNSFYSNQLKCNLCLLEVKIPTGRTHQIRVHFSSIAHPIVGDSTYGNTKLNKIAKQNGLERQFLHAHKLSFKNCENKKISLTSEIDEDLEEFYKTISS